MLKRLYGHELPFPQNLVLLQHGEICNADSLKDDLLKFVIYYDNGICSPCAVNRIMEYYHMFQFFQKKGIYSMILLGTVTDDQYRAVVGILRARSGLKSVAACQARRKIAAPRRCTIRIADEE